MSFGPYLPYPSDRYHGEIGQTSGWLRPTDAPHDIVSPTGSADYLATGAATNGDFGLYRWNMGEEPSGPGNHFHRSISESFFVISGTVRLFDGAEWRYDGRPGDFFHVPPGRWHAFRNESGEPVSMLILFVPGRRPGRVTSKVWPSWRTRGRIWRRAERTPRRDRRKR